jgi:hypothetical protein
MAAALLDGITQEYAQADRLANTWVTFRETRPYSVFEIRLISPLDG